MKHIMKLVAVAITLAILSSSVVSATVGSSDNGLINEEWNLSLNYYYG